jgi:TRAP-type C4-dicarboxylate transport system permease small subunit
LVVAIRATNIPGQGSGRPSGEGLQNFDGFQRSDGPISKKAEPMYRSVVQRLSRLFTTLFASGAAISMLTIFVIILLNSARRYMFGQSVEWGEELPVFVSVYGFMFGMAYAYMQDRHVRFTLLVGFLSPKHTQFLYMFVDLLMIGIGGLIAWSGWLFVLKRGGMETASLIGVAKDIQAATGWGWTLWLGYFYPYQSAIILGGILLSIAATLKFCSRFLERTWLIDEQALK